MTNLQNLKKALNIDSSEMQSLISATDSYKISHHLQYPEGTDGAIYYIESRGGDFDEVVTAGCNYIADILKKPVTMKQVEFMNALFNLHFGKDIFNYEGWKSIAERGYIPVVFSAVAEGTPVPVKTVVATIQAYDKDTWIAGHLETIALRGIWYPSTVATKSRECKKVLKKYLEMTSDLTGSDFDFVLGTRLHDFGARGVSSSESAAIGGLAHLYNFIGTDTIESLILAISLLGYESAAGISIPAREHGTTICYGQENEDEAYKNSIRIFGDGVYACVYDSWSFKKAVKRIADYKDMILEKGGTLVIRPDSGNMLDNIMFALEEMGRTFGYTVNSKGYKVLHPAVRIIQGDEIHGPETIERVLSWMETNKWASENLAFGMGGGLLQDVTRDDQKYAMKLCAIRINGVWFETFKCPEGAEWKASKKGFLETFCNADQTKWWSVNLLDAKNFTEDFLENGLYAMKDYYNNGVVRKDTLEEIRDRAKV